MRTPRAPSFPDGDTPALRELADELAAIAAPDGLAHVILYDRDIAKIALEAGEAGEAGEAEGPPPEPGIHERIGRQLYFTLDDLAPELAKLRSGALIRTVIRAPASTLFFYLVTDDVHLYGATHRPERTDELDRLMARAANDIRDDWRYSQLNFGAFLSGAPAFGSGQGIRGADAEPIDTATASTDTDVDRRYSTPPYGVPVGADWVQDALERSLSVDALHHVAYYRPSSGEVAAADLLDHPDLGDFFAFISRDERREQYRRLGERLPGLVSWLNTALWAVTGGEVVRFVLDVEQGALYLFALPGDRYLVGVTLDQRLVEKADRDMQGLTAELTRLIGERLR
jgi:hypothetical protein